MDLNEAISQLRERNEPVPDPLRLPTPAEVEAVQERLGVTFHPDYRRFLLEAGDVVCGVLEPCTVVPGGGHTDLESIAQEAWHRAGVPRDLVPICEDNGDYFLMDGSGRIRFWSHNGPTEEAWDDLAQWIERVWLA